MIGERLGVYEIVEEIGKGGMATVYKAYQANVDRHVALKVIRSLAAEDEKHAQRFQREARLIAKLEHPHILPIYDFDGTHNPPYIVMRYMDSGTLKGILQHKQLPLAEIGYLMQQISSALDYAHRQGVVHRDIKPSNIMMDRDGNAFVTDLGIARMTSSHHLSSGDEPITASGTIIGTPDYMAPEQALGDPDVDHRADIYSMGVLLFEMLTGRRPYLSESPTAMMIMHMRDPIPSVRSHNEGLTEHVDEVVMRSMAKNPDDRYQSALDFAQAVIAALGPAASTPSILKDAIRETQEQETIVNDGETGSQATPSEQHRQITALSANLTEMEEILLDSVDAEVVHWIMESVFMQINDIVYRNGGVIYEMTDRTLQAIWGVEVIHENDPEKAILAALEIRRIIEPTAQMYLQPGEQMPFQIIINTGPALIQASSPDGERQYSITGQTLTLARRLERAAAPGEILITYNTYRLVLGVFDVQPHTPIQIRGRETVDVFQVKAQQPRALRVYMRAVEGVETKTIGRESDLKHIQDAMLTAIEDSEAQVVTIVGETGVGKSRLLYEFRRWLELQDQKVFVVGGRAVQQQMDSPGFLARDVFAYLFHILDTDPPNIVREKFEDGFAERIPKNSAFAAHVVARCIGYNFVMRNDVMQLTRDALLREASRYITLFFQHVTNEMPMLIQLEDFQWVDEFSLELMSRFVADNLNQRLLVICVTRPSIFQRRPGWGEGHSYHTRIELEALGKRDTRRLVREILQKAKDIPDDLRDLIVDRSEGNPYYVEELIKALVDDGVIVKESSDMWRVQTEKLAALRVPASLTGVLQARIDALLPEERVLLQRGSVLGRIFWDTALKALEMADSTTVSEINYTLERLREREMVYLREESAVEEAKEYIFRHAILRDVVYESMTHSQRREYHLATVNWYKRIGADRPKEYADLITMHEQLAQGQVG